MKLRLALVALVLAVVVPLAGEAQQARGHRIGFISSASSSAMTARDEAFRQGLRALGYVVGQNITIEYRWADGKNERLPGFAAELVNLMKATDLCALAPERAARYLVDRGFHQQLRLRLSEHERYSLWQVAGTRS